MVWECEVVCGEYRAHSREEATEYRNPDLVLRRIVIAMSDSARAADIHVPGEATITLGAGPPSSLPCAHMPRIASVMALDTPVILVGFRQTINALESSHALVDSRVSPPAIPHLSSSYSNHGRRTKHSARGGRQAVGLRPVR